MIISYSVKVGDKVNTGDLVCVLEAMKMQNSLPAPAAGTIKAINFEPGASVAKDAVILVIASKYALVGAAREPPLLLRRPR